MRDTEINKVFDKVTLVLLVFRKQNIQQKTHSKDKYVDTETCQNDIRVREATLQLAVNMNKLRKMMRLCTSTGVWKKENRIHTHTHTHIHTPTRIHTYIHIN